MDKTLEELREDRIKKLVKNSIDGVEKYSIYIIRNVDNTLMNGQDFKRVCAILEKDGKYLCKQESGQLTWEVKRNPNYETNESVKRTNESLIKSANNQQKNDDRTFSVLVMTAATSIISLAISTQDILCNSKKKEFQEQVQSLKRIDSTLLKLVEKEEIKKGDTLNVSFINGLSIKTTKSTPK